MTDRAVAPGSPRQLRAGAGALVALSAAANMASPLYPLHQQAHGMSDPSMTLLHATFAAAALSALLLFGSAADTFGRRPVLLAGIVVAAIGTALFAVDAAGIAGLFLGRVVLGIGTGLGTGGGIALMVEASPSHRPSLGSTAATVAFVAGTGLGPAAAGGIAALTGDIHLPYVAMLVALGLVACWIRRLPSHRPATRQRWRPTRPAVPATMRETFAIASATGFLGWAAVGTVLAVLPAVVTASAPGAGPGTTGAVVGSVLIVSAVSQVAASWLRARAAQTIGLALLALGATLLLTSQLVVTGAGPVIAVTAVAAVVTGAGHGLSYWGANWEADLRTPPTRRAEVTAALYLAFYLGSGLPAVLIGMLAATISLASSFVLVLLTLLLATIAFLPVPSLTLTGVRAPRQEGAGASAPREGAPGGQGLLELGLGVDDRATHPLLQVALEAGTGEGEGLVADEA